MKRTVFSNRLLPWLLLAPQLAITFLFFLWPAAQAVRQSFLRQDAFGLNTAFVGLANFRALWDSPEYLNSMQVTAVFASTVLSVMPTLSAGRLSHRASTLREATSWSCYPGPSKASRRAVPISRKISASSPSPAKNAPISTNSTSTSRTRCTPHRSIA